MGLSHVHKTRGFFSCFLVSPFFSWIHCFHVFFKNSFLFLCAMETQQSWKLSVNKTCLFAWRFLKVSIFSCKSVASQLVDNFYLRTVSECLEWVFGFWWWTNQRGLSPREFFCQGCPPKLINMNHTTYITTKPWIESPRKLLSVLLQFQQRFPSSLTSSHLRKF